MGSTGLVPGHSHLEGLWRDHARSVWAYAARRVGREAAEDIVAQTFVVACRRADQVTIRNPRAWLLGIAANVIRESRRAEDRRAALVERLVQLAPADPPSHDGDSAPNLAAALRALTDTELELLLLVAWDGLKVNEAAEVLGISHGAARTRLLRIRRRLRGRLEAFEPGTPGPDGPRRDGGRP
jgi:RNA polymerase sigma-70 factor (ECF subfamily)